jgi:hypothetical protein
MDNGYYRSLFEEYFCAKDKYTYVMRFHNGIYHFIVSHLVYLYSSYYRLRSISRLSVYPVHVLTLSHIHPVPSLFSIYTCPSTSIQEPFTDFVMSSGRPSCCRQPNGSGSIPFWIPLSVLDRRAQHAPGSSPYSNMSPVDLRVMERTGTTMAAVPTARTSLK